MANHVVLDAVIPINTALSNELDLNGLNVVGIEMPAGWDAAALTFLGGNTYGELGNVYDGYGVELNLTVVAARMVFLSEVTNLLPWRYVRLRSGTAGTPVNQTTAARTVKLVCRPV